MSFAVEVHRFVAHRGESGDAPENTLAAFRLAWTRGIRAVECDVRRSADGRPVVFHDADTRRVTGVSEAIERLGLASIRRLDAGAHKGERWRGEPIPVLDEVLRAAPPDTRLYIEIKDGAPTVEAVARALSASRFAPSRATIIAFDFDVLAEAAKSLPGSPRGWIIPHRRWRSPRALLEIVSRAESAGVDGLQLEAAPDLGEERIRPIHAAGLAVGCWTVNDPGLASKLFEAGVDAITSDQSARLKRLLSR